MSPKKKPVTASHSDLNGKQLQMPWDWSIFQKDWVCITILIIYSLVIWWPTKTLPYHWDSAGFVINTTRDLVASNFSPLVGSNLVYAHPMFIPLILGLAWRLFGETLLVSHLVMLPVLPILLISTLYIGKKLTNNYLGVICALIVGTIPVVITEYGMIYLDLPMAAFVTLALALWLHQKPWLSMAFASIAIVSKLPGILVLPPMAIFYWLQESHKWNPSKWNFKKYLPISIPVATLIIWMVYHQSIKGWLLIRPDFTTNLPGSSPQILLEGLVYVTDTVLVAQNNWIITSTLIIAIISLHVQKKLKPLLNPAILSLLFMVVFAILFFTRMVEFGSRYSMFLLPPLVVSTIYFLSKLSQQKYLSSVVGIIIILAMISIWHPKTLTTAYDFRPKKDLSYMDLIKIGQESATFIETNYLKSEIYGTFPENYQLGQPYQGYVDQKIDIKNCQDFQYHGDKKQIIYIHAYSPGQQICRQLLDMVPVKPLKRFESNGKWLELYVVESTPAATIN